VRPGRQSSDRPNLAGGNAGNPYEKLAASEMATNYINARKVYLKLLRAAMDKTSSHGVIRCAGIGGMAMHVE
jgi:hypothetical protein